VSELKLSRLSSNVLFWHLPGGEGGGEENHRKFGGQVSWCSEVQTSHLPNTSQKCYKLSQHATYLVMYRGFRDGQNSLQRWMYVIDPLQTHMSITNLSTNLFSMEAMTCTTDKHLYKMLQTILQLSKSWLTCATVGKWHYMACDLTWSQKTCVNPNSTLAGGVKKKPPTKCKKLTLNST